MIYWRWFGRCGQAGLTDAGTAAQRPAGKALILDSEKGTIELIFSSSRFIWQCTHTVTFLSASSISPNMGISLEKEETFGSLALKCFSKGLNVELLKRDIVSVFSSALWRCSGKMGGKLLFEMAGRLVSCLNTCSCCSERSRRRRRRPSPVKVSIVVKELKNNSIRRGKGKRRLSFYRQTCLTAKLPSRGMAASGAKSANKSGIPLSCLRRTPEGTICNRKWVFGREVCTCRL